MSRHAQHHSTSPESEDDTATLATEVIDTFFMTMHLLHRAIERMIESHLSGPRSRILLAVSKLAPVRMGDLAKGVGVTPRTMTTMVDALERDGLLQRQPDPHDRRATLLTLTPAGKASIDENAVLERQVGETLLSPLDEAQRQQLLDLLNRLRGSLMPQHGNGNHKKGGCRQPDDPLG